MKKLIKVLLGLLVVLLVLVAVVFVWIDSLAETAVEKGATYALQVPTTVDDVDVGLLGGTLTIEELTVANPEGFDVEKAPYLLQMHTFDLAVDTDTVFEDTIVVDTFLIDGVDMHIIQTSDGTNVNKILVNLKRFETGETEPTEAEKEGKKVKVSKVTVRNVTATFHLLPNLNLPPVTVTVPEVVLDDVSSDQGVPISELIAKIVPAILEGVLDKARDNQALSGIVGNLDEGLGSLRKAAGELLDRVGTDGGGTVKDAGDKVKEKAQDFLNKINPNKKGD